VHDWYSISPACFDFKLGGKNQSMKKLLVVEAEAEVGLGKVAIAIVVVGGEVSTQPSLKHSVTASDKSVKIS